MPDRTYRIGAKVIEAEWEITEEAWAITAGESGTIEVTEVEIGVEIEAAVRGTAAETVEAEAGIAPATEARRARVDREG
jgi:hypothetical protein